MARSNRRLTQFAVDRLRYALNHGPETVQGQARGNTEVEVIKPLSFVVRLFGEDILNAHFVNSTTVFGIQVNAGGFYDSKGRPSRTTRERINGLLDHLGTAGVVPEGVRVFFDEDGVCWIGKGDNRRRLDASNTSVNILACSNVVNFAS